jgi:hypothetical protein
VHRPGSQPELQCAEKLREHYVAESASRGQSFGPAEEFFRLLDPPLWTGHFNPERVWHVASTLEPFVDLRALADRVITRARQHPNVITRTGYEVLSVLHCCVSWIGGIEKLEKFDELAAAMTVPDEGVNLTGEQINTGQQTDSVMAFIFVIA